MKISDYVESQIKGLWGTDFDENGIPVIKTNNLTYEGHIDYSDICKRNITKEQAKECYLKPGDLLIEKSGGTKTHSVGYVSYFEGDENKFVCNNFILALRLKNTINSKFLFYQIQFKYESNQFSDCFKKTTGIQNLKVKDYLAKEIKIYAPEEQEKIVKELDTVRLIINKNKQILEKYDILIKSRFIEMFGNPQCISNNWKVNPLSDYCIVNPKKSELGPIPDDYELSFIPMQSVSENGDVDTSSIKHYKDVKTGFTYFRENDVLFAKITPCMENGKGGVARKLKNQIGFGSTEFHVLRPIETISNSEWIYRLTTFKTFRKDAENNMTGSAGQRRTPKEFFDKYKVGLPPIELQNDFADFVQQIDKSKFAVQKSLEKAETLYKSLMQEYFG